MHGNVRERVQDANVRFYEVAPEGGPSQVDLADEAIVLRGGS